MPRSDARARPRSGGGLGGVRARGGTRVGRARCVRAAAYTWRQLITNTHCYVGRAVIARLDLLALGYVPPVSTPLGGTAMLAPRAAVMSAAVEEGSGPALRVPPWRAARSWLASLVGFVAFGQLVVGMFVVGMPEAPAPLGESATAAVAFGLAGALALGVPAALAVRGDHAPGRPPGRLARARSPRGARSRRSSRSRSRRSRPAVLSDWGYVRAPGVILRRGRGGDDGRRHRRHARWTGSPIPIEHPMHLTSLLPASIAAPERFRVCSCRDRAPCRRRAARSPRGRRRRGGGR